MTLAVARSMIELLYELLGLVKIDGVVDVERGEDREDIRLDRCDEQFQDVDESDEQEGEDRDQDSAARCLKALDDEVSEDVDEDVTGEHRDERTKPKAEGSHHEGNEPDREQQR